MTRILLIYPYFNPPQKKSIFRFPPLGVCYVASSLKEAGYEVEILDCTFMKREEAFSQAVKAGADIVGIYSMVTMREECIKFARLLREHSSLLVAGGPLASCDPLAFMDDFDVVVRGEGERTMVDITRTFENDHDFGSISGIVYKRNEANINKSDSIVFTSEREHIKDLALISFPARDLIDNENYIRYSKTRYGNAVTTIITTRGCPFSCEFCSSAVFGISYRERSVTNVIDEVEQALSFGYDRIHFADDVFTLKKERIKRFCEEIKKRNLKFRWECLGRVDSIDSDMAKDMKDAGCERIFFGIESGDDPVLLLMNKKITVDKARCAVRSAHAAGLLTGAFFILCYPGENDDTVLRTIKFATSLPLDYLSFTAPYPIPGTALYERVKYNIFKEWRAPEDFISDHILIYKSDFSERKMRFAIFKGQVQFALRKRLRNRLSLIVATFEILSDVVFRKMK